MKNKLIKLIEEEIEYDCSGYSPEKICPHCKKVTEKERYWGWWIDHRSVLASKIIGLTKIPSRYEEDFYEWIGQQKVTGNEKDDAISLSSKIIDEWL